MVLVRDWVPRAMNRVSLPEGGADATELVANLVRIVDEIASYAEEVTPSTGNGAVHPPLPVVLVDGALDKGALGKALKEAFGARLVPFAPAVDTPDDFPMAEYAVNVGLACAEASNPQRRSGPSKQHRPVMDLLPVRYRRPTVPVRPVGTAALLLFLAAGALFATDRLQQVVAQDELLTQRVEQLQLIDRQLRVSAARAGVLQQQLPSLTTQATVLETQLLDLSDDMSLLLARLQAITMDSVGPGLRVANLTLVGPTLTLGGSAPTYEDALDYTDALRSSGLFSEVQVVRATADALSSSADPGTGSPPDPDQGAETVVNFQVRAFMEGLGEATEGAPELPGGQLTQRP